MLLRDTFKQNIMNGSTNLIQAAGRDTLGKIQMNCLVLCKFKGSQENLSAPSRHLDSSFWPFVCSFSYKRHFVPG